MAEIFAAGAVVWRQGSEEPEVAVIHRDRYDDWTLPKGKQERGEPLQRTAVREVQEETGMRVRLGVPLDDSHYQVGKHSKTVRWWRADVVRREPFVPNDEVDELAWLSAEEAVGRLTHDTDRAVVEQSLLLPPTSTVAIVRHGKAARRKDWSSNDMLRPLNERGIAHATGIADYLGCYGVRTLASSPATRCRQTLGVYAHYLQLQIEDLHALSEPAAEANPDAATFALAEWLQRATWADSPAAVCGHRPVLPSMLEAVGVAPVEMKTGQIIVALMDRTGTENIAAEYLAHPEDLED